MTCTFTGIRASSASRSATRMGVTFVRGASIGLILVDARVMAIRVPAIGTPEKYRFGDGGEDQSVTGVGPGRRTGSRGRGCPAPPDRGIAARPDPVRCPARG